MSKIEALIAEFSKLAETNRELENSQSAAALEFCANRLRRALRDEEQEKLTLKEAAIRCGYSYAHLRRMMDDGELTNVGSEGAPRVLACELPYKKKRVSGSHTVRAAKNAKQERPFSEPLHGFKVLKN
jgi:hypothetical protein